MDGIRRKAIERKLQLIKLSNLLAPAAGIAKAVKKTNKVIPFAGATTQQSKQTLSLASTIKPPGAQQTTVTSLGGGKKGIMAATIKPAKIKKIKVPQPVAPNTVVQVGPSVNPLDPLKLRPGTSSANMGTAV